MSPHQYNLSESSAFSL
uniref:Uncharacterized protein n=1 Tax=Anguilla anguilla TaxID=7936 RepID=A0A0E9VQN5_ANGAN